MAAGPWMLCSAKDGSGAPVIRGVECTAFMAVRDDVENAGGIWKDEPVVVAKHPTLGGTVITSRTPGDLTPWCRAIIAELRREPDAANTTAAAAPAPAPAKALE